MHSEDGSSLYLGGQLRWGEKLQELYAVSLLHDARHPACIDRALSGFLRGNYPKQRRKEAEAHQGSFR